MNTKYIKLGWYLAIARYQPRPCGQHRGFAPTSLENVFGKCILKKYIFGIFLELFLVKLIFWKYFLLEYFERKICGENILKKIFLKKYFWWKYFWQKKIFFLDWDLTFPPMPCYPPPTNNSHPLLPLIWSWWGGQTKRTYGPDGAMVVPFIYIDVLMNVIARNMLKRF